MQIKCNNLSNKIINVEELFYKVRIPELTYLSLKRIYPYFFFFVSQTQNYEFPISL